MKVALVYDRVNKWGGAERVLLALHKMFPNAPLYTSVQSTTAKWAKAFEVRSSFLQSLGFLREYNDLLALSMPIAFESFAFDEYDLVISVTSEAAKGIITKPRTVHVCYCLTPTRYLWSGYEVYFSNNIVRSLSSPAVSYLKSWDMLAAQRPDYFIAISTEVKNRIKKYYRRESEVIFPPIFIERQNKSKSFDQAYFLLVSRFSRFSYYKKVDLAISAFNKTALPLRIVGSGPMLGNFKRRANNNIEFLGEVTDSELANLYKNARALIFPGREDFGLVMAEAHFFGTPVIAYRAGGALDIVREGKTGEFFNKQDDRSLVDLLEKFDESIYNKADIMKNSERFSYESFAKNFENFLKSKKALCQLLLQKLRLS